jgi:hypothetical protein
MHLGNLLCRCITAEYSREDINGLIEICHKLAFSYLKMKAASQKFFMIRNESIEDMALDFIAELFRIEDERNLVVLHDYFISMDLKNMSNRELTSELRKLVFTKVDDNIYRFYGKKDSSLKKIIRNIKMAIRNRESVGGVCCRNGYFIISPDIDQKKPLMPQDFLLLKLTLHLKAHMHIPEVLIKVREIIDQQEEYQKRFPLVSLAIVIREYFVLLHEQESPKEHFAEYRIEDRLFENEFDQFLEDTVLKVKGTIGRRYVKKGKVEAQEIDLYFKAASDIVKADFYDNVNGLTQYDQLNKYVSDLDYEQFREKQRSQLEYIVILIRKELVSSFKKEWTSF